MEQFEVASALSSPWRRRANRRSRIPEMLPEALAAAFLDVEKVADLASFARWTALEALAPNLRKAKPHRRKGTK